MESEKLGAQRVARKISLVVPFFNEEDAIVPFYARLSTLLNSIVDVEWVVVCVNDGSRDSTFERLCRLPEADSRFFVIDLARNFGKEAALTAGIDHATGDAVIPFDADMQDPPELIPQLIEEWNKGFDVVNARRADRHADGFLKRKTAHWFYKIHNMISDVAIPEDVGQWTKQRLLHGPECLAPLAQVHRVFQHKVVDHLSVARRPLDTLRVVPRQRRCRPQPLGFLALFRL